MTIARKIGSFFIVPVLLGLALASVSHAQTSDDRAITSLRTKGGRAISPETILSKVRVKAGDRFLMCSDGLANFVDDTEIGLALATLDIDEVPAKMIGLANDRGGDDNITVVCVAADEA